MANADGILAGRADGVPLDAVGREQAYRLGDTLVAVGFAAAHRSPLLRCEQTAGLAGLGAAVVDARLNECDYGDWTNKRLCDLAGEPLWSRIQQQPSTVTFPGGESMLAMRDRVVDAARDIASRYGDGDVVALIGHGDPIKAILSHSLGQDFDDFQRIVVAPASVSVVDLPGSGHPSVWCINAATDIASLLAARAAPTVGGGDSPAPRQ